jgi:hypothetical protein
LLGSSSAESGAALGWAVAADAEAGDGSDAVGGGEGTNSVEELPAGGGPASTRPPMGATDADAEARADA